MQEVVELRVLDVAVLRRVAAARCGLHRLIPCELRWEDDPPAADLEFAAMIIFAISTVMAGWSRGRAADAAGWCDGLWRSSWQPHGSLCRWRLSSLLSPCF